jgi:hypothetical protein
MAEQRGAVLSHKLVEGFCIASPVGCYEFSIIYVDRHGRLATLQSTGCG